MKHSELNVNNMPATPFTLSTAEREIDVAEAAAWLVTKTHLWLRRYSIVEWDADRVRHALIRKTQ